VLALQDDDFALFALPRRFAQDGAALGERWKELQRQAHPDRFASQGAAAQRVAMQWSVRINEAYQRLKDPLKRAAYLCELAGQPVDAERNTAMPAEFLLQQMAWREALDEAEGPAALAALADEVAADRAARLARLPVLIDQAGDFAAAAAELRALMFIGKLASALAARIDGAGS